jgi:alpha-1,6-mannosyltransferase
MSLGRGGGVETFLTMLFKYAASAGLEVTAICPGPRPETIGSVHFVPIMEHASTEFAFTRQLRRQLVRGRLKLPADAVVLANAEHYAWAFRGMDVPIVLMSHGALPATLRMRHTSLFVRLFQLAVEKEAINRASRIVVVNPTIKRYYLSRYNRLNPDKVEEIGVGIDLEEFNERAERSAWERLPFPPSTGFVLFVGRLYPEKNLPLFISSCDDLWKRGEQVHALVVGKGIQTDFLRDAMKTRPRLHWIPEMTHSEMLQTIAVARALTICSLYESGPLVLLESIALGTPVVSTEVGRARELLEGYLGRVATGDSESFATAIQEVLKWTREDVRKASGRVRMQIDFSNTVKSLGEILRSVARQPQLRSQ